MNTRTLIVVGFSLLVFFCVVLATPAAPLTSDDADPPTAINRALAREKALAEVEKRHAEYLRAIEVPSNVPASRVAELFERYSYAQHRVLAEQVKSLQAEVDQLRAQLKNLSKVTVRPL